MVAVLCSHVSRCFLVGATVELVHALQVPGLRVQGLQVCHGVVGRTVMGLLSQLHRGGEVTGANLPPRLQPRFDVRKSVQKPDECRTLVDADGEQGAGQAGAVAEEGDTFVGRFGFFAEVGDEAAVERRCIHVANVGGDEERGLGLGCEGGLAFSHEGLLDVPVKVGLGQVVNRWQYGLKQ